MRNLLSCVFLSLFLLFAAAPAAQAEEEWVTGYFTTHDYWVPDNQHVRCNYQAGLSTKFSVYFELTMSFSMCPSSVEYEVNSGRVRIPKK